MAFYFDTYMDKKAKNKRTCIFLSTCYPRDYIDSRACVTSNISLWINDRVLFSMKRSLGAHGMAEDESLFPFTCPFKVKEVK